MTTVQTRRLMCVKCSTAVTTSQQYVNGVPIIQWFTARGMLCTPCFQTKVNDPRKGRVHHNGSDTEHEAAESVRQITGRLRKQVLELLAAHPQGLTDDEGGVLMQGDRLTFGRRRQELVKEGLVADSGQRRLSPQGRKAIVWQLK